MKTIKHRHLLTNNAVVTGFFNCESGNYYKKKVSTAIPQISYSKLSLFVCLLDGASCHFQQYFSYIVAVKLSKHKQICCVILPQIKQIQAKIHNIFYSNKLNNVAKFRLMDSHPFSS